MIMLPTISSKSIGDGVIVFDTSIQAENLGDFIINHYCNEILEDIELNIIQRIGTQIPVTPKDNDFLLEHKEWVKLITGTNVVINQIFRSKQWYLPIVDSRMQNLVLMGAGLARYDRDIDWATKKFYQKNLSKEFLHSVRDCKTELALKTAGIQNVINTSCPTMWRLTPEFCYEIPKEKANDVITTVTDYNRDTLDFWLLDKLLENYKNVYLWVQGEADYEYVKAYPEYRRLKLIPHNLQEYKKILEKKDLDYVGTRLHAGIIALNYKKRTLIIAVDGRAKSISDDTGLPVIEREEIKEKLLDLIFEHRETKIELPKAKIEKWKAQFRV